MTPQPDLSPILQRLDALAAQVGYIADRQRRQEELLADLTPIAKGMLAEATTRLDAAERKGYFRFGQELIRVAERIVEGFSPDDVHQLGDAIVGILDTLRTLTQPEMLAVVGDAADAVQHPEAVKPMGMFGMVRATRDDDVQKGMALMVEVMRRVGKGVSAVTARQLEAGKRTDKLAQLLGPRRGRKVLGIERQRPPTQRAARPVAPPAPVAAVGGAGPTCGTPAKPQATAAVIDGIAYSADGHLADPAAWTRPLCEALAAAQGVTLDAARWAVIDAARADFAATKMSPNIRRLTQVAQLSTKDLYALFPRAPGRTIAKIAGLPKPAGCL